MANTKSAKKAINVIASKTERNKIRKSRVKTFVKRVDVAIEAKDASKAQEALKSAESELFKAVAKGIVKKNTASRKVSRLTKKVNAL